MEYLTEEDFRQAIEDKLRKSIPQFVGFSNKAWSAFYDEALHRQAIHVSCDETDVDDAVELFNSLSAIYQGTHK